MGKSFSGNKAGHASETASLLSKLFFWWTVPLIWLGFRRELEEVDFQRPPRTDWSEHVGGRLGQGWNRELNKPRPSLKRAVFKLHGLEFSITLVFAIFQQCVLRVSIPVFLGLLIRYMQGQYSDETAGVLAALFIFVTFLSTIIYQHVTYRLLAMSMRIRVALTSIIYHKALSLSQASLAGTGVGKLTNLISNDVNRFDRNMGNAPYIFACPLQLILVGVVLWSYTGPSCLAGIGFLILMVPVSGLGGKLVGVVRGKGAAATDTRVRLLTEVLNGMLLIKMFTWEAPYSRKMAEARRIEVDAMQKRQWIMGFNFSLFEVTTRISILLTFLTYVLTDNPITVESVFVTLSMYNIVAATSAVYFPWGVMGYSEMMVSLERIQKILEMEEVAMLQSPTFTSNALRTKTEEVGVRLVGVSARWSKAENLILSNLSLEVKQGQLVGVIGPVGSGKSTLIQSILGEVLREGGDVSVVGTVAYASQEPCFFSGSVKDNILFGKPFEPTWYETVVDLCALDHDLRTLLHGDETLVGDKGINLSGGQKARISLARAVYSRADIYLLDDPLSAVDARVARHLMEKCIRMLARDKCVLLVTHQVHFLREAREVISLEKGVVINRGSYEHVCATLDTQSADEMPLTIDDIVLEDEVQTNRLSPSKSQTGLSIGYGTFGKQRAVEEGRGTGLIPWKLYIDYFRAGNSWLHLSFVLLLAGITQVFFNGADFYLQQWTNSHVTDEAETNSTANGAFSGNDSAQGFVSIYAGFVLVMFVFAVIRALTVFRAALKSSVAVYVRLFAAIMRAPMRFFEINSVGRVLNRFSNDIGIMDEYVPQLLYILIATYLQILGSMILVVLMDPVLLIPSLVQVALFFLVRHVYVAASSRIKRNEGIARSPVFAQLSTTLSGISVVRAYGAEGMLVEQFDAAQDAHTAKYIMYLSTSRWFQNAVELISDLYISCVLLTFLFCSSNASAFGLAISASLTLILDVRVCMGQSTEIVNQIVAVERTMEYTNLRPEAPLQVPGFRLGPSWLQHGSIRLDQVSVAYENGVKVLRDITLQIRSGEKVGIVGRTGAGKSSLIACLFRIVEPITGKMHISNVDICRMGLHDLRRQLSIIPQNPVVFSGTLRQNLDPFNEYSDSEIWDALEAVQLESRIRQKGVQALDLIVNEGGSNFSHGEKQLLCLARTILCKSKILILDEATANVDTRTDSIIQETLRKRFSDSTVLTIAHRLDTVMDSDRILALDAGLIKDFDEPSSLLHKPDSFLYKLVSSTGPINTAKLRKIADEAKRRREEALLTESASTTSGPEWWTSVSPFRSQT